jgi:hypothetical protein
LVGLQVQITVTNSGTTANNPLALTFVLDASIIPPGQDENTIVIFRNGTLVPNCATFPGSTVANPDPCVSDRTLLAGGDVQIKVLTSAASTWNVGVLTAGSVGGIAALTVSNSGSPVPWMPLAAVVVTALALGAGLWYSRRRWVALAGRRRR